MSENTSEIDQVHDLSDQYFEGQGPDNFTEVIQKTLLISPKNAILFSRNNSNRQSDLIESQDIEFESRSVSLSSSLENLIEYETVVVVDPFFILPQSCLSKLMNFPPHTPKPQGRITSESLFQLGKEEVYLGLDLEATKSFEKSIFIEANNLSFIWKTLLVIRNPKLLQKIEKSWCGRRKEPVSKITYKENLVKLDKLDESIEKNWALMEMAAGQKLKIGKYIEPWQYYASKILNLDKYYGFLAWGSTYCSLNDVKGPAILQKIVETYVAYPHAYINLWHYHYARKEYLKSYNIIAECFVKANDIRFHNFSNLIYILYSKSLCKLKRFTTALEMIQRKYEESDNNLLYLYHFGKICIKCKSKKFIVSGLSALKEVLRWVRDYPKVNFWFAVACYKTGRLNKAEKHFHRVLYSLNTKEIKISTQVQKKLRKIQVKKVEIQSYKKKLSKEKFPKLHDIEEKHYVDSLKIMQAEDFIQAGNIQKSLDILEEVQNYESFLLIYNKIIPNLPFEKSQNLLLDKIDELKINTIPLYEFINSCTLYAEFLKLHEFYDESFSVLKSILNFYPKFKANVPYIKNSNISMISVKLIGLKNLFETSSSKKKDLIIKAVKGKSLDFCNNFSRKHHKRVASLNIAPANNEKSSKSPEKQRAKSLQTMISGFGVFTSPKVLLKCAEVLQKIPDSAEEVAEILHDFLEICEKPFFRNLASKILETVSACQD